MKNEELELLLKGLAVKLKNQFSDLTKLIQEFIEESSKVGAILYIQEQRFTLEECGFTDGYKIKKALNKVLALEYDENISIDSLPGTTETFHAVIALPHKSLSVIKKINEQKNDIGLVLKEYVNERVKINGKWTPVNKVLLKEIGRPRANVKQIKRRLNHHADNYQRLSLSCTNSRPSYKKTKQEIIALLQKIKSDTAQDDITFLEKYNEDTNFAYFYDKTYSVIDGNFRYKESVIDDQTNEICKKFKTQKISSPVYIICDDPKNIKINVIFRNKEGKQKKRTNNQNVISKEKILMSLPVFEYEFENGKRIL
jgi:hypothetical protein